MVEDAVETMRFWNSLARDEDKDQDAIGAPGSPRFVLPWFSGLVKPGSRVLDIGVGYGRFAIPLSHRRKVWVVGFDISDSMLARAWANSGGMVELVRGDAHWLPFRGGSFDAAYSIATLYYLARWDRVIREVSRVLKPGGLFVSDFRGFHPRNIVREAVVRLLRALGLSSIWKYSYPHRLTSVGRVVRVLSEKGLVVKNIQKRKYRFSVVSLKSSA